MPLAVYVDPVNMYHVQLMTSSISINYDHCV